MRAFALFLSLLATSFAFSQNYQVVDNLINAYPGSFTKPEMLATQINKDFSTPQDKARAIYSWIAKNVRYDLEILRSNASGIAFSYRNEAERIAKEKKFKSDISLVAIRDNKAICHGYAALYEALCNLTGIECLRVNGSLKAYPEQIGLLPKVKDHAWNVVKIDGSWKLIDTTLAAGSLEGNNGEFVADYNEGFFFTSPELFFLNHYPNDKKWLLISKTEQDFANLPLFYREYIRAGYKISNQLLSTITPVSNSIIFKFDNLDPSLMVTYFTDRENKLKVMDQNEVTLEYTAYVSSEDNYLTIVINNKMIATYKLKAK